MKTILLISLVGLVLAASGCAVSYRQVPTYFYAKPIIVTPTTKYDYFIPGSDSDIYYYSY